MAAMRARTPLIVGAAFGFLCHASAAFAGEEVAAQALFEEAKKLAAQGNYAKACPMFAESNRLDRGAGTLIHLGNCYEKNKQSASAWATYKEAASAAQALNRKDWESLAKQRAAALEPKLAYLTVKVDPANEKAEITRDGTPVAKATWGVALPIDAGAHTIDAKAPGFKPFTTSITIAKDGEKTEVSVPKLEEEPAAAPPAPPPTVAPPPTTEPAPVDADKGTGKSSQRTIGFIVAGVGVAGLAVGAVTGLMAISKASDAKDACPEDGRCRSASAVDAADSARTLGLVSTIGFIAGGVGLAGGAALVFTAPSSPKKTAVRLMPSIGGLTLAGSF